MASLIGYGGHGGKAHPGQAYVRISGLFPNMDAELSDLTCWLANYQNSVLISVLSYCNADSSFLNKVKVRRDHVIGLMSLNHRKMEKKANKTSDVHRHEKINTKGGSVQSQDYC